MSDFQCITTETIDGVMVATLTDNKVMDPARIQSLGDELLSLVSADGSVPLVVSLKNVRFLSSAAINKLIVLERRVRATDGKLSLCDVSPEVKDVFVITHLHQMFNIQESQNEAIGAVA